MKIFIFVGAFRLEFNRVGGQQMCVQLHSVLVVTGLTTAVSHFLSWHVVDKVLFVHLAILFAMVFVTLVVAVFVELNCLVSNGNSLF